MYLIDIIYPNKLFFKYQQIIHCKQRINTVHNYNTIYIYNTLKGNPVI